MPTTYTVEFRAYSGTTAARMVKRLASASGSPPASIDLTSAEVGSGTDLFVAEFDTLDESEILGEWLIVGGATGNQGSRAIQFVTGKTQYLLTDEAAGGGDATEAKQDQILAALAASEIVRVGPGWDPETQTITLRQGDDYSADKGRAITFDLTVPGISLVGATAKFRATKEYQTPIEATASILDPSGSPQLQLEWSRSQLSGNPGTYHWDAEIIDSDGEVATVFSGTLCLEPSRTALVP